MSEQIKFRNTHAWFKFDDMMKNKNSCRLPLSQTLDNAFQYPQFSTRATPHDFAFLCRIITRCFRCLSEFSSGSHEKKYEKYIFVAFGVENFSLHFPAVWKFYVSKVCFSLNCSTRKKVCCKFFVRSFHAKFILFWAVAVCASEIFSWRRSFPLN